MTGGGTTSMYQPDGAFWRSRAVAVTGATGFLGGHLTSMLIDQGAQVVVLVRDGVPPLRSAAGGPRGSRS